MGDVFQASRRRIAPKTAAVHCNGDLLFGFKKTRGVMTEAKPHAKAMARFCITHIRKTVAASPPTNPPRLSMAYAMAPVFPLATYSFAVNWNRTPDSIPAGISEITTTV